MKFLKSKFYIILLLIGIIFFFYPFFTVGKVPIPADALIGLFHPWRDQLRDTYPNGIPVKNSLITDPIRQQYPYRIIGMHMFKNGIIPSWNPYSFSGTPLLANIQSALLYPGNFLFFIFDEINAWSLLVLLQPLLAALFTYYYLRNLSIKQSAATLGALSFAFSGFMIAWLSWNTIGHVALWLPLILLAKDRLVQKFSLRWALILILAESSMVLAGHLQTAMYIIVFSTIYLFFRLYSKHPKSLLEFGKNLLPFIVTASAVVIITSLQIIPTVQFIFASARNFDLASWQREDWFLPLAHLVQFIAPDFFGNPTTGNYWGVWNYVEFVGYIGIISLFFAFFAFFFRRDKKTLFFSVGLLTGLLLAISNPLAQIPYHFSIPYLATLQPTRIMVLICFCGSMLGALGFDYFIKSYFSRRLLRKLILLIITFGIFFVLLWIFVINNSQKIPGLLISKRNLFFPSGIFIAGAILLGISLYKPNKKLFSILITLLLLVAYIDQFRFAAKFIPFVSREYMYPQTKLINFLQSNLGQYRYMTTDRRILPPNTSMLYKLQTVDGYDPLYLRTYSQMISAWTRNKPDITLASFNRILTPERFDLFMASLFGVRYIVTIDEISNPQLKLVFTEGETDVYENLSVFPRAFLLEKITQVESNEQLMTGMFNEKDLSKSGFTTSPLFANESVLTSSESATIIHYSPQSVVISVVSEVERILVLTDPVYPNWKATIDGKPTLIYPVDLFFRGIKVPKGNHSIQFDYSLLNL